MDDSELASKYQQKTDKGHILDNPDTYIGSVEEIESNQWVLSDDGSKIIEKTIKYIPGLFKLFDEGVVNCRDHVVRMLQQISSAASASASASASVSSSYNIQLNDQICYGIMKNPKNPKNQKNQKNLKS